TIKNLNPCFRLFACFLYILSFTSNYTSHLLCRYQHPENTLSRPSRPFFNTSCNWLIHNVLILIGMQLVFMCLFKLVFMYLFELVLVYWFLLRFMYLFNLDFIFVFMHKFMFWLVFTFMSLFKFKILIKVSHEMRSA
ncbi:histone H3 K4-specific methyltransferase SET7/9family protein, partial [Striga asiatica]